MAGSPMSFSRSGRSSSPQGSMRTTPAPDFIDRASERLDATVAARAVPDLPLALDRVGGLVQHRCELHDPFALGADLEEALLDLRAEVDAGGDLVGDRVGVEVEVVELGLGGLHDAGVGDEALLDLVLRGRVGLVRKLLDLGRLERAALGELDELDALARLDDDVQPPVRELVDHLDHGAACPHVAHALLVLEDEAEVAARVEALADQLPVARLEDVQGRLLAGGEHEAQGGEADLHPELQVKVSGWPAT